MIRATFCELWWPQCDRPVYVDRIPVWTGSEYADPDTGEVLPTWREAVANLRSPAHLMRLGDQFEMRGIIAPSAEADRAVRYLCK